jgi:DNA-binding CsgD family transcriptional regulator
VAELASAAAQRYGLDPAGVTAVRRAAFVHDVGRVAVPIPIWHKEGSLTAGEWERVRLHPYYSERVLSRSPFLAGLAPVATAHHERLDGSGYHRGAQARELPIAARLLAAADAYQTKTEPRPYREALAPEQAAAALLEETASGGLDADAVRAVLAAAGASGTRVPRATPAGLTERELEVLRLIAAGCSNREVAQRLVISPRTAEHHVQHIYEKIGTSTRAGAVMFALQHDLLAQPAP